MANNQNQNKQLTQQQKQELAARAERRRAYEQEKQGAFKTFIIVIGALLALALTTFIVTLTTHAVYVYNSADGGFQEVFVRGSAFLKALFTNNYTSAESGYDDLGVPFYVYAAKWCQPAAIYTLLTFLSELIALLLLGLTLAFAIWKKDFVFILFPVLFEVLTLVFASLLFKTCLDMKNGSILSTYCSGNPLCSIRSDAIAAAVLAGIMLVLNIFGVVRYMLLQKKRKAIKG